MVGKAWEGKPLRGEGLQPVTGESQEDPNAWPLTPAGSALCSCILPKAQAKCCSASRSPAPSTQRVSKPRVSEEAAHRLLGPPRNS